ncbi:MAG: hypothetical protein H6523_11900 [Mycolicibacterium sp.]|nr:hypothetical protein [Mycolicibacterium sp.]
MNRFTDDVGLVAPEDYVPTSVQALLPHLGLQDAPRSRQESGIRTWLASHEPGELMKFTLREKGFGHLLDGRASA